MHYVQVNKNYFQKVYANGNKKRISRNEYLEKTKQKGGNDQIKIEYDGKTYNYQMGATNNIKTGMAPKLKSDFVKNAKIKIGNSEFPLCNIKPDGECESKGLFGTNSLISRKNKRDVNVYNNNFILKRVAEILKIPISPQSGGGMKGGEPVMATLGTVVIVLLIIWMCSDVQGPCTEMSIAAMRGGQNTSGSEKLLYSLTQINKLKSFYNNVVKKNSYFKIGNFEQDGTINSSFSEGKEYFMKVKFSSDLGKTHVQIDEIVCINDTEKNEMKGENEKIGNILGKQISRMCPQVKNFKDLSFWEKVKKSKEYAKEKFCIKAMENAKKEFEKYQNNK